MKLGTNASEQLNKLGIPQEVVVGQMRSLDRSSLARLSRLGNGFGRMSAGDVARVGVNKFSRQVKDARQDVPQPWSNLTPAQALEQRGAYIEGTYYQEAASEHASAGNPFPALFNRHRRRGAIMVQRMLTDPLILEAFERQTQLTVVNDGRQDGGVSVSAMSAGNAAASGASGGGFGSVPGNMWDVLSRMDEAIMVEAAGIAGGVSSGVNFLFGLGEGVGSSNGSSGYGGFGMGGTGTVENGDGSSSSSIDLMTFQLKRLMDKKTQAYDLVRSVFDKHNEGAKTAINNMKA